MRPQSVSSKGTPLLSHLLVDGHADEEGERVLAEERVGLFVSRELDS
jgi:hypothetical protein